MSSQRQQSIEFHRNYCTHYNPQPGSRLDTDYCNLKCGASEAMARARDAKEPQSSPCIGGHRTPNVLTLCPKWERHSLEQAEKHADDIEATMQRILVVDPVISKWRTVPKPANDRSEVIECPQCKGKLHLAQSSYNGHVRARCETENCVSFIE